MRTSSRLGLLLLLGAAIAAPLARAQLQMAITIDDLPVHGELPRGQSRLAIAQSILDTLKQNKMPPTYGFVNGVRTEEDPGTMAVLEAWRQAGQPLGNHAWSHPNLAETLPGQYIADIEANQPLLRKLMGTDDWHWFRYPYLSEGETPQKRQQIRSWLSANHYHVAPVTMDFADYNWNSPYARCVARNDTAAIKELHDTYLASAAAQATYYSDLSQSVYHRDIPYVLLMHIGAFDAKMLPELLQLYRDRGFTFIPLAQAAADPVYADGAGPVYASTSSTRAPRPPMIEPAARLTGICK